MSASWTFTRAATSGADPALYLSSSLPRISWNETDGAADNRLWTMTANSEQFVLAVENDAHSAANNVMTVDRTGTTVDSVAFPADNAVRNFVVGTANAVSYANGQRAQIRTTANAAALALNNGGISSTLYIHNEAGAGDNAFVTFATDAGLGGARGGIDYNRAGSAVRFNTSCDRNLKMDIIDA